MADDSIVADDWRVTVTFRDEADLQRVVQSVRDQEVDDDVRRAAEHRRLVDAETQESLAAGQPGWEVHVQLRWHRQAVELAERLQAEGHPVIRRWRYLVLGANNEDDASALAAAISQEMPAKAWVYTQTVPFIQFADSKPGT